MHNLQVAFTNSEESAAEPLTESETQAHEVSKAFAQKSANASIYPL